MVTYIFRIILSIDAPTAYVSVGNAVFIAVSVAFAFVKVVFNNAGTFIDALLGL